MDKVYIKYNPYRVTTEIKINEQPVKKFSKLNVGEKRLQEWVDNLPNYLYKERNNKKFEIVFHGTDFDYEDVKQITEEANKKHGFNISLTHIPAKKINPKDLIEIYNNIQETPFDELKTKDVESAFKLANSKEFEVNVIATMSAGKSTLINALLGRKVMPARHEATTATITKIKDNKKENLIAYAYDDSGKLLEKCSKLNYSKMNDLNDNPKVSNIVIEGDIPFVSSDEVSLVLIDTPGPNNARDPRHGVTTRKMLSDSSKSLVLYVLNANQSGITDDSQLLDFVAENMQVSGKQSRDRFIFVLNQLDEFWNEEDDIKSEIEKTRKYLEKKGIQNPNIYPASAITALNIRTVLTKITDMASDDSEQIDIEEAKKLVRRSIKCEKLHLEKYAPVPNNVQIKIENLLNEGIKNKDLKQQSLIHSGIISLEEGIKLYVEKYATPLKIKTISDMFIRKVDSAQTFNRIKEEINSSEKKRNEFDEIIHKIEVKLHDGKEAKRFRDTIEALNGANIINQEKIDEILSPANKMVRKAIEEATLRELTTEEAEEKTKEYENLARQLQASVISELEELIESEVVNRAKILLEAYKQRIRSLTDGIHMETIEFSPFNLIAGDIPTDVSALIKNSTKSKEVPDGWEFSFSFNGSFWPWNWSITKPKFKSVSYVNAEILAQDYFSEVQSKLMENVNSAKSFANEQIENVKYNAREKFDEIDGIYKEKVGQLKSYKNDRALTENELNELRKRQEKLTEIRNEIEQMLEI